MRLHIFFPRTARRRIQLLISATLVFSILFPVHFSYASSSPLDQVQSELVAAESQMTIPSDVSPPLASWSGDMSKYFSYNSSARGQACLAGYPAVNEQLENCVYGSVNSRKVIVLAGDSQAFQWLPAIDPWAKSAGFKVVVVTKEGCRIWPESIYLQADHSSPYPQCPIWRSWAITQILKLHPVAVVVAGEIANVSPTELESTNQIISDVTTLRNELAPDHAKLIMMQNIPWFWGVPSSPSCLAMHSTDVNICGQQRIQNPDSFNVIESEMYDAIIQLASNDVSATLPVDDLVCSPDFCPTIAGPTLMYVDDSHLTRQWTTEVSAAFGEMLKPLI